MKIDTPKIDEAFDKLNELGILARKDWTCCQTCGHYEIKDELKECGLTNYVFYHDQDTDYLNERGFTYIAYGLDKKAKKVVMKVFKHYGLNPEWNGSEKTRIKITERLIQ